MPDDGILSFFDRTQLFKALWTVPMVDLGKKYGISGATVRRVCGALEIPIQSGGALDSCGAPSSQVHQYQAQHDAEFAAFLGV